MDIPSTILKNIDQHRLIPPGMHAIVAVSGGADSVALLHAFKKNGIPCTIAHMNHLLRGDESNADEQFVRGLAQTLDVSLLVKSVDVRKRAETSGDSIEMAARKARHDFFSEFENSVIALAHHADDQVETFLLKLARGAGPEGLSGMSFSQNIGSLRLIRPMLNIPQAEIIQWLKSEGHTWREDSSNSDEGYLRNKIRHSILPMLERELNPNLRESLLRTMNILQEENAWMDEQLASLPLQDCGHPAARRRILRKWLFEHGVRKVSYEAVEHILALMKNGKGTSVFELNADQRIVVEYGTPRLENNPAPPEQISWNITVQPSTGWQKDSDVFGKTPAEACFEREKVGNSPITVRSVQPGDRMNPLGMAGSRKLQDIFTDLKIPRAQRNRIPIVTCRNEIIWIPGYRISRDWAVSDQASSSIRVRLERNKTD